MARQWYCLLLVSQKPKVLVSTDEQATTVLRQNTSLPYLQQVVILKYRPHGNQVSMSTIHGVNKPETL